MNYVGFLIGGKHTWRDWGLKCFSYKITAPVKQKNLIQVPGRNGKIDAARKIIGNAYEHRNITMQFDAPDTDYESWAALCTELENYMQDEVMELVPDFDSDYYYKGWVSVVCEKEFKEGSEITISVDAEPFKYKRDLTVFNESVSGTKEIDLPNGKGPVNPRITSSGNLTVQIGDAKYAYAKGVYDKAGFIISPGGVKVSLIGDGVDVKIEYREGML